MPISLLKACSASFIQLDGVAKGGRDRTYFSPSFCLVRGICGHRLGRRRREAQLAYPLRARSHARSFLVN
jgi:hypothetical protein